MAGFPQFFCRGQPVNDDGPTISSSLELEPVSLTRFGTVNVTLKCVDAAEGFWLKLLWAAVEKEAHCTEHESWSGAGVNAKDDEDWNMPTSLSFAELTGVNIAVILGMHVVVAIVSG